MITFEYDVKGIPYFLQWADFIVTSKNGEHLGADASGFLLDETDYTNLANAISDVGNSLTDFSTLLGNEVTARSEGDEFLQEQLFLLDERINNLLFDPVDNSDVMDGARKYVSDFIEVFSTDQVDGLNQKFALFTNVLNSKISDINASAGTGLLIDKSNPAFPLITQNRPAWNQVQNKPMLFPPEAHSHSALQITGLMSLLDQKVNNVEKGAALGVASLDASGKVPASQLPALDTTSDTIKIFSGWFADQWTSRTSPVDNDWRSICWSLQLGIFVAVSSSGTGNRVMTSPDGINWTSRTSPVDNDWRSICWSLQLGIFVAVSSSGTGNRVMTSPDGINWTARTSAVDNNWNSVCWSSELGLFVAVSSSGTGNRVMTSPDGINWTLRISPTNNWVSVSWSTELGLLVAVSNNGTGNRVMTSPDGINWTSRASAVDNIWSSVCWSEKLGLFVSVANTGTGNRVMTTRTGLGLGHL